MIDLLSRDKLQEYADSVAGKGAALSNCFGFVDGTVRPISVSMRLNFSQQLYQMDWLLTYTDL